MQLFSRSWFYFAGPWCAIIVTLTRYTILTLTLLLHCYDFDSEVNIFSVTVLETVVDIVVESEAGTIIVTIVEIEVETVVETVW